MKKDKQLKDIKRRRTCKIVCVLLFLLISVIGICVHFNIIKIPFVVDLLERTEQKQEFGDFSGQLIGESYIPKRGWYFSMKKHPILRMTSWLIFKIRGAVISFNTVP